MGPNIAKKERAIFLVISIQVQALRKVQENDRIEVDGPIQAVIVKIHLGFNVEIAKIHKWIIAEDQILEGDFIDIFKGGWKDSSW